MRIWSGCSSLFFTLNPHDIRSPLTVVLINREHFHVEKFSLDLPDGDTDEYFSRLLQSNPRLLHEMASQDPLAATRCFHYTVRLVIDTLFNSAAPGSCFADSIPARVEPGVYGHLAGYLGVVEPQMRKSLHLHMLIQLLGFAHPDDIFKNGRLIDTFRKVWSFVASICFRSTEAFAAYIGEAAAMTALQEQPLMPITAKQRGMIGVSRADDALQAQLKARGMKEARLLLEPKKQPRYYTPCFYANASMTSSDFAVSAVVEVNTGVLKSGNHVCRAEVCHKGKIGKQGFCRMSFWHWVRCQAKTGQPGARRAHGLQLQSRWDGQGAPPVQNTYPHLGQILLETCHPFYFKLSPSMMLGPRCNHDLGILLRLAPKSFYETSSVPDISSAPRDAVISGLAEETNLKDEESAATFSQRCCAPVSASSLTSAGSLQTEQYSSRCVW